MTTDQLSTPTRVFHAATAPSSTTAATGKMKSPGCDAGLSSPRRGKRARWAKRPCKYQGCAFRGNWLQLKSHMSACNFNPRNIAKAKRRAEAAALRQRLASIRAQACVCGWTDALKLQLEGMQCRVHAVGPVDPASGADRPRIDVSVEPTGVAAPYLPRTHFELHCDENGEAYFFIRHLDPQPNSTVCCAIVFDWATCAIRGTRLVIPAVESTDVDMPVGRDPTASRGAVEVFLARSCAATGHSYVTQ